MDGPASSEVTQQRLGWHPTQPSLISDLDNNHYFKQHADATVLHR